MKDFEQEYSVFQKALKIEEPWYITSYQLDQSEHVLHIHLDFKRGARFVCPNCSSSQTKVHDVVNEDRT
ncbi:hypothetical protein [Metabacillus litoralis]|jgi:transposase|uniref:hypothetical protein n=1 Tax=Metabacillus litoralis TaxID=152268 RepID=UPI00203E5EA3|nr:hypothetical protein [Metabacillus litoralis]MCM3654518.1 hypothetical protein [Metabacillus litoralis]